MGCIFSSAEVVFWDDSFSGTVDGQNPAAVDIYIYICKYDCLILYIGIIDIFAHIYVFLGKKHTYPMTWKGMVMVHHSNCGMAASRRNGFKVHSAVEAKADLHCRNLEAEGRNFGIYTPED